jgi:hypothetical protein
MCFFVLNTAHFIPTIFYYRCMYITAHYRPSGAVMFDEANLNADPERGTRQKISEPKTPYHHSYSASHESDASHSAESEEDEAPICITALTQRIEQHQQQTGNCLIWKPFLPPSY